MAFNSVQFLYFFPSVVLVYFLVPRPFRWIVLLLASYGFYMAWKPEYVLMLAIPTVADWFIGKRIASHSDETIRKRWLLASLALNIGILFTLKYYNLIAITMQNIADRYSLPVLFYGVDAALPAGISFYTFQTLGYVIDVYRQNQEPETKLSRYALFLAFFPALMAGPISRARQLLPQHAATHSFDYNNLTAGLQLMLWGFFKKLVIADRLAIYVSQVYDHPKDHFGWDIIIATYFFAYQIYCDFSGYTDIARGCAQVLGYTLPENFRRPYAATSIRDFWQRWHITLTSWFREYLFFALGVSRKSKLKGYRNVVIVFLVCGLWHGASWTFVVWGGIHGLLSVASLATAGFRERVANITGISKLPRLRHALQMLVTFHAVLLAWVFFRANSFADIGVLAENVRRLDLSKVIFNGGLDKSQMILALVCIALLEVVQYFQSHVSLREWIGQRPVLVRWSLSYAALFVTLLFAADSATVQFLYFQF
ncbi:MAG: MBOAT family O-acyltransferase [Bryobacteraceae bacterium]|nr:MBOAT family O-acyltransferase [Bryobacteraceae bacterium]